MQIKVTDKPWGYEILFAHTDKYAGKVLFVKEKGKLSLQYHKGKDETLYIYEGKVKVTLNDRTITKREEGVIHVAPLTRHRIEALEDTIIFEVSTPEIDDVVRLENDYGRVSEQTRKEVIG